MVVAARIPYDVWAEILENHVDETKDLAPDKDTPFPGFVNWI